jgi:glycosyltransferase involved in cell wall biosynthesis
MKLSAMKLSAMLPSYKDPYLQPTINSILENSGLGDDIEVIVVLDGFWAEVVHDPRVRVLHLGRNRGMRDAINAGVSIARGDFLMRADTHCMFAPGFAKEMTDTCKENEIMTAVRYFLDPVKWERMDLRPYVYEKLKITEDGRKFEGRRWGERERERKDFTVDETMAMQGSFWIMPHQWWKNVIGELQTEGYGPLIQDSHEMVFKTWKAGGRLMVNKNTWFAHKHVSFPRTHNQGTPENPAQNEKGYKYCVDTWKDYYYNEIVPLWNL